MSWEEFNGAWLWRVTIIAFLLIATWETIAPRLTLLMPATRRWRANFGLYLGLAFTNYLFNYLVIASGAIGVAFFARGKSWTLLNDAWTPYWFQWVTGFLLYDFTDYWVHRWGHQFGPMWRLHHVHHSDPDCDLTTALRFHPVEFLLGEAFLIPVILIFGPPISSLMASILVYSVVSLLTHANARVPLRLDRLFGWVFITPDMHRTHHAADLRLQSGNYATVFSFWDRIFGTFIPPVYDLEEFGLREVDPDRAIHLPSMLLDPFRSSPSTDANVSSSVEPINRSQTL